MYRELVPLEETGLNERGSALTTLVLSQGAFVCFKLIWVCICSFTAIAAEPLVLCVFSISDNRCPRLGVSLTRVAYWLLATGRPSFWSDKLGYGRNFRLCSNSLRPLSGTILDRFSQFSSRGLWNEVWVVAQVVFSRRRIVLLVFPRGLL